VAQENKKPTITQAEKTTRFNEWLKTQPMPKCKEVEDRQRWWVGKVIEFDGLIEEEYNIVSGFWVDGNGKVHYSDDK
jgi:hypothetical protein